MQKQKQKTRLSAHPTVADSVFPEQLTSSHSMSTRYFRVNASVLLATPYHHRCKSYIYYELLYITAGIPLPDISVQKVVSYDGKNTLVVYFNASSISVRR